MKKLMIAIVTGLLFLGAASQRSYADPCGCGGGGMGMQGGPQIMHHGPGGGGFFGGGHFLWKKLMGLGLSDKQIDSLKAIRDRVVKDTIKKRADLELAGVELRELLDKDSVDMGAVETNLKKAEALRTGIHLSHIKAMQEIKAILTPEQRKKLKDDLTAGCMMRGGMGGGRMMSAPPVQESMAPDGMEE